MGEDDTAAIGGAAAEGERPVGSGADPADDAISTGTPAGWNRSSGRAERAARAAGGRTGPAHHAAAGVTDPGRLLVVVNALLAVLGTLVAGAALYAAHRVHGDSRAFALVAAGLAAVCVVLAAAGLLARLLTVGASRRSARRPLARVTAGVAAAVLVAALAASGVAVAVAVVGPSRPQTPRLAVRTDRDAAGARSIRVEVTVGGLAAGAPVAMSLTALPANGTDALLASAVQRATGDRSDTVRLTAHSRDATAVQVDMSLAGRLCQAVVPIQHAVREDDVRVTCTAA